MLRRALRPLSRGLCTGAAESGRRAATLAVHAGEGIDASTNASAPPISVSTTFAVAKPLSFRTAYRYAQPMSGPGLHRSTPRGGLPIAIFGNASAE